MLDQVESATGGQAVMGERPPKKNPIRYGTLHIPIGLCRIVASLGAENKMSAGETAAILIQKGFLVVKAENEARQKAIEQKGVSEEPTGGTAPDTPSPSLSVSDPPAPP